MEVIRNYINGEWIEPHYSETVELRDPATLKHVAVVGISSKDDVNLAVDSAENASNRSQWGDDPALRSDAMLQMSINAKKSAEEIAEEITRENGQLIKNSRMEALYAPGTIKYYSGLAENVNGRSTVISPSSMAVIMREPVGVVGIIVPWNAPIYLLVRSLGPALAAGNSVVIKPSIYTTGSTAKFLKSMLSGVNIPPGVINMVVGTGETVGEQLVSNRKVDMISFTGDTRTGKSIMKKAADQLKRVSLELGGKSPNIILDDANIEKAVRGAVQGACFYMAGQICFAGTRLLVQKEIASKIADRVKAIFGTLKIGPGSDESTDVPPLISGQQVNKVINYIEEGRKEAKLYAGGRHLGGYFIEPTLFTETPINSSIFREEIFGPVLTMTEFETLEEAAELANSTNYGLAAGVWSSSIDGAMRLARKIKAGTVWINDYGKMYHQAIGGGYKESGMGRLYGIEGLNEFTELKHININY
ncbi:MAG: aldehyde dehydrogenase family protein [Conexivisphaerales archaeon]